MSWDMTSTIGHIDLHNIKPGDMLDLLDYTEWHMHHLLTTADWKDVLVDYHEPFVERVWCEFKGLRVFLHRIHPSTPDKALMHGHPWPSAIRLLRGRYTMDVGRGTRVVLREGCTYEMVSPDGEHAVIPNGAPSFSLMVTAPPWETHKGPKPTKTLGPLDPKLRAELLAMGLEEYPSVEQMQAQGDLRRAKENAVHSLYLHAMGESVPTADLSVAMNEGRLIHERILREESLDE